MTVACITPKVVRSRVLPAKGGMTVALYASVLLNETLDRFLGLVTGFVSSVFNFPGSSLG